MFSKVEKTPPQGSAELNRAGQILPGLSNACKDSALRCRACWGLAVVISAHQGVLGLSRATQSLPGLGKSYQGIAGLRKAQHGLRLREEQHGLAKLVKAEQGSAMCNRA
eukprot:2947270-Pyramimonas_sp.AAC.1